MYYLVTKNELGSIGYRQSAKGTFDFHEYFKNHSENSSSMKDNILLQSDLKSEKKHWLIYYNKLIVGGDASTFKKIYEVCPHEFYKFNR